MRSNNDNKKNISMGKRMEVVVHRHSGHVATFSIAESEFLSMTSVEALLRKNGKYPKTVAKVVFGVPVEEKKARIICQVFE